MTALTLAAFLATATPTPPWWPTWTAEMTAYWATTAARGTAAMATALLAGPPGDPTPCPTLEAATGTALFATANAMATLEAQHFTRVAAGTPSTPPAPWDTSVWPVATGTPTTEPTPTLAPTATATAKPAPTGPTATREPLPTATWWAATPRTPPTPRPTTTPSSTPVLAHGAWLPLLLDRR